MQYVVTLLEMYSTPPNFVVLAKILEHDITAITDFKRAGNTSC